MTFDFTFFSGSLLQTYVLHGFLFSLQLTVLATCGGIVLGTVLALMRLSQRALFHWPATVHGVVVVFLVDAIFIGQTNWC
jgi:glutamate/aspartate transport system permease protein